MEAPLFDEAIRRVEGPATDKGEAHLEKYFEAHDAGFVGSTGYTSSSRRLDAMILEQLYTAEEAATSATRSAAAKTQRWRWSSASCCSLTALKAESANASPFSNSLPGAKDVCRFFTDREDG